MDLAKLHLHWRSCRRDKKEYKSYSLARAYRSDGKNRKEIVLKLGKLDDEEVSRWRAALQAAKKSKTTSVDLENFTISSNSSHLDVAVILEAWNFWDLNRVFDSASDKKQRSVPLSSIASILAANRCLNPASKSRVSPWVQKTTLPFLLNLFPEEINPSRIFRELIPIEDCKDKISQHLCQKMLETFPEDMKSLFYDLSSTTFTGGRCLLVSWGHCKEGYENHIVLALVVNAKGFPLYWEVLEGGTSDATTIPWLLDRLKKKLPITIPTMVFDRGMVSDENLRLLEENGIKYITAMDKNQIEDLANFDFSQFKTMNEDDVESLMDRRSDFIKLDETTYCKEINLIGDRRYVLCFNAQLFKDQKKARTEQIAKFEKFMEEQNQELLQAQKNRSQTATQERFAASLRKGKLQGFIEVRLEEKYVPKRTKKMLKAVLTYQAKADVNEKKKQEVGKLDGFWLLVTNHSEKEDGCFVQNTEAVVQPYREKVIIESSFRDIKSFIEISPVHVWKPEHVKAHYTICVLSHLIDRTLSWLLHKEKGSRTKEIVSHARLYEELSGCRLNHIKLNPSQNLYRLTEPTSRQKELLTRLGMKCLVEDIAVKTLTTRAMEAVTSK